MRNPESGMRASLLISSALALSLVSPSSLNLLAWKAGGLSAMPFPPAPLSASAISSADLDGDGQEESLELTDGIATIHRGGDVLWSSPANWRVIQTSISDFNHDRQPEVALLLWRDFAPWLVCGACKPCRIKFNPRVGRLHLPDHHCRAQWQVV